MKINVTWSDIRNGSSARTTECMVALALKRELGVDYASVGYGGGSVLVDGKPRGLYLPLAVRNRIKFWDRFHFVLPFSFELTTQGFLTGTGLQVPAPPTSRPRRELFAQRGRAGNPRGVKVLQQPSRRGRWSRDRVSYGRVDRHGSLALN